MISIAILSRELSRIKNCFGKDYPDETVKRIHVKVKNLSVADFIYLVDTLIDEHRFTPTPSDYAKTIRALGLQPESKDQENINSDCPYCGGDGVAFAEKKEKGKEIKNGESKIRGWLKPWAFRCPNKCKDVSPAFLSFNFEMQEAGYKLININTVRS
jgi:hypothetical protein